MLLKSSVKKIRWQQLPKLMVAERIVSEVAIVMMIVHAADAVAVAVAVEVVAVAVAVAVDVEMVAVAVDVAATDPATKPVANSVGHSGCKSR